MSVLLKIGKCVTKSILVVGITYQYVATMEVVSNDNMDVLPSDNSESSKKRNFEESQLPSIEAQSTKHLKRTPSSFQEDLFLSNDYDKNLFSVLPYDVRKIINRYMMSPYIFREKFTDPGQKNDLTNFYYSNPGQIAILFKSQFLNNQHSYSGGLCRWFAMAHRWNSISFTSWNLSGMEFGDEEFKVFANALAKNRTIRGLNLSNSNLTLEKCSYLAEVLKVNTSIIDLNLSYSIRNQSAICLLFMVLKHENKTLKNLNLSYNYDRDILEDNYLYFLIEQVLSSNHTLTTLNLDGFQLNNTSIKTLINIIGKNKTLKKLSLLHCRASIYIDPILKALKNNTSLKELILFNRADHTIMEVINDTEPEYLVNDETTSYPADEPPLIKTFREQHGNRVEFYG